MVAALKPEFWWYVSRSSGMVAWVLLTLSVLWGLLIASRMIPLTSAPKWLLDLHRFLGGLTVSFTALHVLALTLDSYLSFGLREIAVPMASPYEPGAVAWGVVAAYLLVAVEVSSLAMRRLPRRVWRYVHLTSFVVFALVSLHAVLAGTDVGNLAFVVTGSMFVGVTLFACVYRMMVRRAPRRLSTPR